MFDKIALNIAKLREKKPLIYCLTNYVTMEFVANSLLAIGAAPIMSEEIAEVKELIDLSDAININVGTLDEKWLTIARHACLYANSTNKPVILDPVGCGASKVRTDAARELLKFADIIRGNASEIISLYDDTEGTFGVEAVHRVANAKRAADYIAKQYNITVVVSGEEDFIIDSNKNITLYYGSELMPIVTGMGCGLTAVIAAFKTVCDDYFAASKMAVAYYGLCGEAAEKISQGPGSFRANFIDKLYNLDLSKIQS